MAKFSLISAIGTPLTADEQIHIEGLEAQLDDQWKSGMTGVLVGGSMGAMQLLSDQAYHQLSIESLRICRGKGEVMVGVGDTGLARTTQRIRLVNQKQVDGVVVLSPFLFKFSPEELVDYYRCLADASKAPLYLYDLPVLTGMKLSLDTVRKVAEHRNVAGIKCSCDIGWTRSLLDLKLPNFRVIVAAANLVDVLMRAEVKEHLDGVFALAPHWVSEIARAAERSDWTAAAAAQGRIIAILSVLHAHGPFATFSTIMNARGIPGNYAPKPYRPFDPATTAAILESDIVKELLRG
jgi:4-hydroxy-tetrahydrodipicolinate synthase